MALERCIWVHQFNQLGEKTAQDIAQTLLPRGIRRVYAKAMDGTDWMASIYTHPLAPANAVHLGQLSNQFSDVGLQLIPWVVPRFSSSEADAHIAAGRACGGFVIDFEYLYPGFWRGSFEEARAYFDRLRAAKSDTLWIAVAPDPRQLYRDYEPALIGGLSAYLPQNYWTDFQQPATNVMSTGASVCEQLGPNEPILPYNGALADVQAAIAFCEQRGYGSISLFRMGVANAGQLDAFAGPVQTVASQPDGTSAQPDDTTAQPPDATPQPDNTGDGQPAADDSQPPAIPQTYLDRGWDTWPAVTENLEAIIHELMDERDAALAKLDQVESRAVGATPA
jgi:hypothetical protein